jgi:excisionase family DNA binding protein
MDELRSTLMPSPEPAAATAAASDSLMTTEEVAAVLRVEACTLATWRCRKGMLPFVKVGRLVRYRRSDIDQYLALRLCAA